VSKKWYIKWTDQYRLSKNELKRYSEADSEINDEKTFNNLWEDKFTTQLRNAGIIDENLWFKREKFNSYLS